MTQEETTDKIKQLANKLNGKARAELLSELYWTLTDSEKDEFLRETLNA